MQNLNFPNFEFRFKSTENRLHVFDIIRKKFVVLQPEEWVRQHVVHNLITIKGYPKTLINVEKQLIINGLKKRYDVVVFKPNGSISILVECKAPEVNITQNTFNQIAIYNMNVASDYLMVTNGLQHYYCQMDNKAEKYVFLKDIPDFSR
ncbi:type I restriction enzyme HsdR N-terminal domain-containing protein [Croceivirga sp. JEA036]|uniref:type I restriction enzyme HsdR N-terminal domain-containing protein n=1 Tax=Croceivirga sp. JEA036 TaxID=2721162 RepID=UPI00143A86C1|nr:type I restriction enzyme HsdR N-terminal domain-containing protein [Croceivirga sp. JEA036]NJB35742.1 type I restriction enzyme HsdR N-terminal domain-containing protein [Croceivirga sp. JEA036]